MKNDSVVAEKQFDEVGAVIKVEIIPQIGKLYSSTVMKPFVTVRRFRKM